MRLSELNPKDTRYVYFARRQRKRQRDLEVGDEVKIGMTVGLATRMYQLRCDLIVAVPCEFSFAERLEKALHQQFFYARSKRGKEWFFADEKMLFLINTTLARGSWPWDESRREVITP